MGRGALKPHEEKLRLIISSNIKHLLNEKGLKAIDLRQGTGIPQSSLSEYINAKSTPTLGKVQLIADFFGVEKSDIDPSLLPDWDKAIIPPPSIEETQNQLTDEQRKLLIELSKYDLDEITSNTMKLMLKADDLFRDKIFSYAEYEYFKYEKELESKKRQDSAG